MKELHELKEMLCDELKVYGKKGELTAGSLDVVDKLTHTIKNLDKIIEAEEDGASYNRMGSYDGRMMDRGRYVYARRGQKRDAMGRYSRMEDGYSRHDDMIGELRYLMDKSPDEHTRMEFQRFIDKMEQM